MNLLLTIMKRWQGALASALLLCVLAIPATAGEWVFEGNYWSGSSDMINVFWGQESSPNGGAGKYKTDTQKSNFLARNQTERRLGLSTPYRSGIRTNLYRLSGEYKSQDGIPEVTAKVGSSVYARFNWRRNMKYSYDEATGNYSEYLDPNDNPPSHVYVRETASVFAGKGVFQRDGNETLYTELNPWQGDYYEIKGEGMGATLGDASRSEYDKVNSWRYEPTFKSEIRKVPVSGDSVAIPSRSFTGEIKLLPGYENENPDLSSSAYLGFGYSTNIANSNFSVSAGGTFTVQTDTPEEKEIDAFIGRGFKENEGDTSEDAARQFWSGSATYSASIKKSGSNESFFQAPNYKWSNQGDGSLFTFDEEAPIYDRQKNDISVSSPTKELTHDLGEITAENLAESAREFPKTTTVKVEVSGDEEGDPIEGTGTINWHVPFGTIYKISLSFEAELPDGETLDLSEVPDDEFGDSDEWDKVEEFEKLRKGSPRLWLDAFNTVGKETILHFAVGAAPMPPVAGTLRTPFVQALKSRHLSRGLHKQISPFLRRGVLKWNKTRKALGKSPANIKTKIEVETLGTVGTINPNNPPKVPKWWEILVPVGTGNNQSTGTTTNSPAPKDGGGGTTTVNTGNTTTTINGGVVTTTRADGTKIVEIPDTRGGNSTDTNGTSNTGNGTRTFPDIPHIPDGLKRPPVTWPSTGTVSKGTANKNRPQLEDEEKHTKDTVESDTKSYLYWFYTSDPAGFASRGADRWNKPSDGNPAWPTGYYFTTVPPWDASKMTRGRFSFGMFGTPYQMGGSITAVPVEFDLPLPLHSSQHQGALPLYRTNPGAGIAGFDAPVALGGGRPSEVWFPTPVGFQDSFREPGAQDVPEGNTLPSSQGSWRGQPGESIWDSTKDTIRQVDARSRNDQQIPLFVPIEFERGYPDFTPWTRFWPEFSDGSVVLPKGQTGVNISVPSNAGSASIDRDMYEADTIVAERSPLGSRFRTANGEPSHWLVKSWRDSGNNPPLVWHHHEDMKTMQLVPKAINNPGMGGIPHRGGGSFASKARW